MAKYIKVSTISITSLYVDPNKRLDQAVDIMALYLKEQINQVLPDKPDLIVLPEICDIPYNYDCDKRREYYSKRSNMISAMISEIAVKNQCYITYPSIFESDGGNYVNAVKIIDRSGGIAGVYEKRHPTLDEIMDSRIVRGKEPLLIECDFGSIACSICFDLNFVGELGMRYKQLNPTLLVFSSVYHGGLMQSYWAYLCRCHLVSSIAGGVTSHIISPVGETIASTTNYFNFVTARINLDCAVVHLDYNRNRLHEMKKKYGEKINIMDPGHLGSVLISNECDEFTINDLVREFKIELLDDYLKRARSYM